MDPFLRQRRNPGDLTDLQVMSPTAPSGEIPGRQANDGEGVEGHQDLIPAMSAGPMGPSQQQNPDLANGVPPAERVGTGQSPGRNQELAASSRMGNVRPGEFQIDALLVPSPLPSVEFPPGQVDAAAGVVVPTTPNRRLRPPATWDDPTRPPEGVAHCLRMNSCSSLGGCSKQAPNCMGAESRMSRVAQIPRICRQKCVDRCWSLWHNRLRRRITCNVRMQC